MVKESNYYRILDVPEEASTSDIKKAYRKLMLKYHPDVNQNEPLKSEYFEKVVEAYKILSDDEKRAEYDRQRLDQNSSKDQNVKEFKKNKKGKGFFSSFSSFLFKGKDNKYLDEDDFFQVSKEVMDLDIERLKEQYLESSNKYVRAEALKALIIKLGKQAFKYIEKALEDHSKEVKEVAVRAIGKLQIRQGILYLAELFPKSGPDIRVAIVQSVASLNFNKANDLLVQFCYDSNDEVRLMAVKAIAHHKYFHLLPKLKGLVHDRHPEIKDIMTDMLER